MLDDDDYELLQESNISVNRPKLVSSSSLCFFRIFQHLCLSVLTAANLDFTLVFSVFFNY